MELMSSGVDLQKLLKRVPGEPHSEHVGLLVGVGALALGDSSSCQPRWSRERRLLLSLSQNCGGVHRR